ncbi:MAG: VWA domain-containing protein [SAR202 cluster bacterium]|nr:MAG: VWA domain-containing protein [SAR202 cluster bacterium]KAA1299010.1 MAG: VWA domain-containing protein [SAR202 cluster bacterium]|tara:strand:- start:2900 stop:6232 length:3333 start_codon:yes stop_codon:yes gene_type:complete
MENISKFDHEKIKRLLKAYPEEVTNAYLESREILEKKLPEEILYQWENIGVDISKESARSWESALAYFNVSVKVQQYLPSGQFLGWSKAGYKLSKESTKIAESFLTSSPMTMIRLRPRYIDDWVTRVTKLYKGTWKSTNLTCKLFESTPVILETLSFDQYCKLVDFIDVLSNRSYDYASEILDNSIEIYKSNFLEIDDLIHLSLLITEKEWRDIKPVYEIVNDQIIKLPNANVKLIFDMCRRIYGTAGIKISEFLQLILKTLALVNQNDRDQILQMNQQIVNNVPYASMDFLTNTPRLLDNLDIDQLDQWKSQGIRLAIDQDTNTSPASQFFKLQSKESNDLIDRISSSVELHRIKDLMKLFCTALCDVDVAISETSKNVEKNIGWTDTDLPTTDGKTIYLPSVIKQYSTKEENFSYYKIISARQAAYSEYGTFKYDYRLEPINPYSKEIFNKLLEQVSEMGEEHATRIAKVLRGAKPFIADPQFAAELFNIVEAYRIDELILKKYPGLRNEFRKIRLETLNNRTSDRENKREIFIEEVIKFTLGKETNFNVPKGTKSIFNKITNYLRTLTNFDKNIMTVEDSMMVTVRLFDNIRKITNDKENEPLEEIEELPDLDESEDEYNDPETVEEMMSYFGDMYDSSMGEQSGEETQDQETIDPMEENYSPADPVEYQGDFKPELGQLLTEMLTASGEEGLGEGEEIQGLTQEQIEELVQNSPDLETKESDENPEVDASENQELLENLMKELKNRDLDSSSFTGGDPMHIDEEGGPLEAKEPDTFTYPEWDFRDVEYKPNWCLLHEKKLPDGEANFYKDTLTNNSSLVYQIKKQFELFVPEQYRKQKRLEDGEEADLDAGIEALIDLRSGVTPDEKIYWRRNKTERSVAVAMLIDMSASTAEAIDDNSKSNSDDWGAPDDPVEYMIWLRSRRAEGLRRSYKRIVDVEKEGIVLMVNSLEMLGDDYGIYGFSGYGRENVEFYTIKDLDEKFNDSISGRIDRVAPLHATRMGPAIRHTITKLADHEARSRFIFLITDGRPQDRGYSREGVEKEYAVYDTRQALIEARQQGITPFCLTVDKSGHDYLKTMMDDFSYEVLSDISMLPARLPELYKNLTT